MMRRKFTTTLDENVIQELKMQAVREKTDVSKIIERCSRRILKRKKEETVRDSSHD